MLAIGLMSGTSLDGVDLALVDIKGYGHNTKVKLKAFQTYPLGNEMVMKIKKACHKEHSRVDLICSLNFELGYLFSNMIKQFCKEVGIQSSDLDFIASHGQTIYHIPRTHQELTSSSLQIGESSVIAYEHQTTVISNFRVMDIAAKGEGAPLVPYSEYILYRQDEKNVALVNIGGISNITVLPKHCQKDDVYAFDMGPGNMMINEACVQLFHKAYDKDGQIAKNGQLIENLLNELKQHSFILSTPPKSTGREEFGQFFVEALLEKYKQEKPEDIVTTLTYFTAYCIAVNVRHFVLNKVGKLHQLILSGGGAYNQTLIQIIKELLSDISVVTQEDIGMNSDAKEAIAFVIMGNETLHHRPSNMKSATGAVDDVILGNIIYPPRIKRGE